MLKKSLYLLVAFFTLNLEAKIPSLNELTLDEKIGQLFFAGVYSNVDDAKLEGLEIPFNEYPELLIKKYHIGGLLFKQRWNVEPEMTRIKELQAMSSTPLFIAQDFENGLIMRLPEAIRFPQNMTLGAVQDMDLIEEMGREVAKQARYVGVNYNFSPVVDVNNNPDNPVIHLRSFGDNPQEVAKRGIAMMKGLQNGGVIACAKHFPGHGDTSTDSHHALPLLPFKAERLRSLEMYPFKKLIDAGVMSIMMGHLAIPAFEPDPNIPASLSKPIVTGLLIEELGFKGLIIIDDLLMKAISDKFEPGDACLKAFLAGNDLIMEATTAIKGIEKIKQAVQEGIITEDQINHRVNKVLKAKEWIASQNPEPTTLDSPTAIELKKKLYEAAITLVRNKDGIIPVKNEGNIAVLQFNNLNQTPFFKTIINSHPEAELYLYSRDDITELSDFPTIIIPVLGMTKFKVPGIGVKDPKRTNYGIQDDQIQLIKSLQASHKVVLVIFGSPYSLSLFPDIDSIVLGYEDDPDAQIAAAKVVVGELTAKGKLPVKL